MNTPISGVGADDDVNDDTMPFDDDETRERIISVMEGHRIPIASPRNLTDAFKFEVRVMEVVEGRTVEGQPETR
jgi:hypothetical protein